MSQPSAIADSSFQRFQILSLDGGGIRGIFSAAVLAAIEDDLGVEVDKHFDLVAGTSTGGIIALALGLGIRPRQILEFYVSYGARIFERRFGLELIQHWMIRKYSSKPLESALKSIFGDKSFGDSSLRLVVPAYNLDTDEVYNFRTPHLERLRRDYRVPAWKVAMATSAAPTFFSAYRGVDSARLLDGGIWANNPSMVAIVEAACALDVPMANIAMLSIGTLSPVVRRRSYLDWVGLLGWARKAPALIMRATSTGVVNHVRHLLGPSRFQRIDPAVPDGNLDLDSVNSAESYLGRAGHFSRSAMPEIRGRFFEHKASPYTPLHRVQRA